ncbi:hypothetical protein VP01_172g2 [Puccinia sorghi]|uniref:Uncharacterized protein n=1 Tax=Puccinia sorghi TaxID=27349 RepID=A0A0L6VF78_9BASI|nr:hypothetical protein VP01_172g2 [Puccinia sorghi]
MVKVSRLLVVGGKRARWKSAGGMQWEKSPEKLKLNIHFEYPSAVAHHCISPSLQLETPIDELEQEMHGRNEGKIKVCFKYHGHLKETRMRKSDKITEPQFFLLVYYDTGLSSGVLPIGHCIRKVSGRLIYANTTKIFGSLASKPHSGAQTKPRLREYKKDGYSKTPISFLSNYLMWIAYHMKFEKNVMGFLNLGKSKIIRRNRLILSWNDVLDWKNSNYIVIIYFYLYCITRKHSGLNMCLLDFIFQLPLDLTMKSKQVVSPKKLLEKRQCAVTANKGVNPEREELQPELPQCRLLATDIQTLMVKGGIKYDQIHGYLIHWFLKSKIGKEKGRRMAVILGTGPAHWQRKRYNIVKMWFEKMKKQLRDELIEKNQETRSNLLTQEGENSAHQASLIYITIIEGIKYDKIHLQNPLIRNHQIHNF